MVKRIILFVFFYAILITALTLTMSQADDTYLIVITISGLLLGVLIVREIYKKYFSTLPVENSSLTYSTFNSGNAHKISSRPFLFGFEKKIVSADDFYFDHDSFYAVNKNQQLSKTSYRINNSRIWQVKITNNGEEAVFRFAHNYSFRNKNFLNFYNTLKEVNPPVIKSNWSSWII
jgi:hypothetical protein